jgi:hypothetical protein
MKCANIGSYNKSWHFGPNEAIHEKTCVDIIVTNIRHNKVTYEEAARRMCDGCVASFMWRHMIERFIKTNKFTTTLLVILLRLDATIRQIRLPVSVL